MTRAPVIGAVAIGRNEGARLDRCLASLAGAARVVYVDSGSTDGSLALARARGAEVVELDLSRPFTAARARNEGLARLVSAPEGVPDYIQFVDGDCELRDGWLEAATAFLEATPQAAVACGRRRERHPGASVYNRLIDREWDTPAGRAKACGGDALMRTRALVAVGGYDPRLIAGEEPELCVRLRAAGWEVWRLDREMTWHDAAMTRLSQWWRRARRAGHAYAEGAALHGAPPERHNVVQVRRALLWGAGVPLAALAALPLAGPWAFAALLAWPVQVLRLARRDGDWPRAILLTFGKIPEMLGVAEYHVRRLVGRRAGLIEYK